MKETWNKFVEQVGHKHPYDVHRVAKVPFSMSSQIGTLYHEGQLLETTEEKVHAIAKENLVQHTGPPPL